MHNDITIYSSKRFAHFYHGFAWVNAALAVIMLLMLVLSGRDGVRHATNTVFIIGALFFGFLVFVGWFMARKLHRSVSLKGSTLTFVEDGLRARTWSVDTSRITEIYSNIYTLGRQPWPWPLKTRGPHWDVKTDDGKWHTIEFSFFTQADRDKFLPIITELVQRPGMIMGGIYFKKVLKAWFGDKAPSPPDSALK